MKKDVVIFVAVDQESKEKILLALYDTLEDFRQTCGIVAVIHARDLEIYASYIQDEYWKDFLNGVAYWVDKKHKENKNVA